MRRRHRAKVGQTVKGGSERKEAGRCGRKQTQGRGGDVDEEEVGPGQRDTGEWLAAAGESGSGVWMSRPRRKAATLSSTSKTIHSWMHLVTLQVLAVFSMSGTMFWLEGESSEQGSTVPALRALRRQH